MHGKPGELSGWLLPGDSSVFIEPGPASSIEVVIEKLRQLVGPSGPTYAVATHIHLDHAGGAGELLRAFPNCRLFVHQAGARHLIDPSRLMASARRVYGGEARTRRLWGDMTKIEASRLTTVSDSLTVDLEGRGKLSFTATRGHAKHHMCIFDHHSKAMFVGDAVGIRDQATGAMRPAVPPPDIDVTALIFNAKRLLTYEPATFHYAHFGASTTPSKDVAEMSTLLEIWSDVVSRSTAAQGAPESAIENMRCATQRHYRGAGLPDSEIARIDSATTYRTDFEGLERYLRLSSAI